MFGWPYEVVWRTLSQWYDVRGCNFDFVDHGYHCVNDLILVWVICFTVCFLCLVCSFATTHILHRFVNRRALNHAVHRAKTFLEYAQVLVRFGWVREVFSWIIYWSIRVWVVTGFKWLHLWRDDSQMREHLMIWWWRSCHDIRLNELGRCGSSLFLLVYIISYWLSRLWHEIDQQVLVELHALVVILHLISHFILGALLMLAFHREVTGVLVNILAWHARHCIHVLNLVVMKVLRWSCSNVFEVRVLNRARKLWTHHFTLSYPQLVRCTLI